MSSARVCAIALAPRVWDIAGITSTRVLCLCIALRVSLSRCCFHELVTRTSARSLLLLACLMFLTLNDVVVL